MDQIDHHTNLWVDPYGSYNIKAVREFLALPHKNRPSVAIKQQWLKQGWWGRLVHLLAILIAGSVAVLCTRETYFVDVATPRINIYLQAFQFIAKVHDIVVTASLTDITIYYLTFGLCQTSGLPLGLVMAPFRLASPSALFEKPYRSSVRPRRLNKMTHRDWRAIRFGLLVLLATIITAAITPLSAILIVPQLAWWNVDKPFSANVNGTRAGEYTGFTYWDMAYDNIWPASLGEEAVPRPDNQTCWDSFDCPYYDLSTIKRWGRDFQQTWTGSNIAIGEQGNMIRYLTATRETETGFAVASAPMSGLSRNLGTMWLWARRFPIRLSKVGRPTIAVHSADDSNPILRPLVQSQCGPTIFPGKADTLQLQFPTNRLKLHPETKPLPNSFVHTVYVADFERHYDPSATVMPPRIVFIDLEDGDGTSAVGAIVAISFGVTRALYACTMSFHWVPSVTNIDPQRINVVAVVNDPDPADFTVRPALPSESRTINVDASYMRAMNVPINDDEDPVLILEELMGTLSMGGWYFDIAWEPQWSSLVGMMLSLQSAAALSRFGHHFNMFIWFINATNSTLSSSINLVDLNNGYYTVKSHDNQQVLGHPQIVRARPENYTEVAWEVQRFGYAWSLDSGWQQGANILKCIALGVILFHSAIIVVHHVALAFKRLGGNINKCVRWDTPLDLLILALQTSEQHTNRLRGTSTKVNDSNTYRDVVRIEASPKFNDAYGNVFESAIMTVNDPHIDDVRPEAEQNLIEHGFELPMREQTKWDAHVNHASSTGAVQRSMLRPEAEYF